jgi:hypothetical protein
LRLHASAGTSRQSTEQVWCFDKKTEKVFRTNIKNVLAGSRFYEVDVGAEIYSLERSLTWIEDDAAPIVRRITSERSILGISLEDRAKISIFAAAQFARTQAFVENVQEGSEGIVNALRRRGFDPTQVDGFSEPSDDQSRVLALSLLSDAPKSFAPHFLSKTWYLIEGVDEDPFHLGDNPIVRENPFGAGIGLACPGVTIYLPLSPTLCLVMTDAGTIAHLLRGLNAAEKQLRRLEKRAKRQSRPPPADVVATIQAQRKNIAQNCVEARAMKGERILPYNSEFVMRANSLQMKFASRWVISSRDDFNLPRRMLSDDERYRRGVRVVVD